LSATLIRARSRRKKARKLHGEKRGAGASVFSLNIPKSFFSGENIGVEFTIYESLFLKWNKTPKQTEQQ
jgi:hypothetical protein